MGELPSASAAQHFVEEVSLTFEPFGVPRIGGQIIGWLLIADPPQQTGGDLAAALGASKASISTMTRFLIQVRLIERVRLPGQRRDYFQIRATAWAELLEARMAGLTTIRRMAERGLAVLADAPAPQRARLETMYAMYAFFEREMPALMDRWHAQQAQRPADQAHE